MKKVILATLFSVSFALGLSADIIYPDGYKPTPEPYEIKKFGRGVNALLSFWVEIPKAVFDLSYEKGALSTEPFTVGIPRGHYNAFRRLSNGVYDVFYWDEDSNSNQLHHMDPEFLGILDAVPTGTKQFDWETIDTGAFRIDSPVY